MFSHRKPRRTPFQREADDQLEALRDDCIAIYLNSGMTQKDIHARGGPTPQTISRWLYKETLFPRYSTIDSFARAVGYGMQLSPLEQIAAAHQQPLATRLGLDIAFAGKPRMPAKRKQGAK